MFDSHEELYSSRPYGALDSGFNSVDSGDKRWSGNEVSIANLFLLSAILYGEENSKCTSGSIFSR